MSEFVDVKVSELLGGALDWAVAKAEGFDIRRLKYDFRLSYNGIDAGRLHKKAPGFKVATPHFWQPSVDWNCCGRLIEKYAIEFEWITDLALRAEIPTCGTSAHALTHLIAACRAIVASVFGETVSVPRELV